MDTTSPLYHQIFQQLSQQTQAADRRHLKALAWMWTAVLLSQSLTLSKWEPYVQSAAKQAQSYERRWQRFLENPAILVEKLYLPLVLTALSTCHGNRLYLALDTTILWDRYCMIHLSVCCCVLIQADVHPTPIAVGKLTPPINEAKCYKNVRLWADGRHGSHLVLATVERAKDSWAVITDETPTIQTL